MPVAQTLHEIALEKAKKRPELVDFLTEEAPILAMLKWIPATHGLWNVEEVLDSITGATFTELGAPLPSMKAETQLRQTFVSLLGGEVEVSKDKADQFGGAQKYFARRENAFFRQAGMDTELAIWRDYWRRAALKHKLGLMIKLAPQVIYHVNTKQLTMVNLMQKMNIITSSRMVVVVTQAM